MRRREPESAPTNIGWIISFADMVTILLAFLALIIGITAHDMGKILTPSGGEEAGGMLEGFKAAISLYLVTVAISIPAGQGRQWLQYTHAL